MAEAKEVGLRLGLRLGERARFGVGLSRRTEAPLPLRRRVTVWSGEVERLPFALCVGDRGIGDRTIGDRGIDGRSKVDATGGASTAAVEGPVSQVITSNPTRSSPSSMIAPLYARHSEHGGHPALIPGSITSALSIPAMAAARAAARALLPNCCSRLRVWGLLQERRTRKGKLRLLKMF